MPAAKGKPCLDLLGDLVAVYADRTGPIRSLRPR
jgi:hypothetical protein